MKIGTIYFGSLKSPFALSSDWSGIDLGIFASSGLETIVNPGMKIFSYTHKDDTKLIDKINLPNHGLFLDYSTAPNEYIDDLAGRLHSRDKRLIVNTGWGANTRDDYGKADILLIESFLGTHSGDDGHYPVTYSRTDEKTDITRLKRLKQKGYEVITLTYGPSNDIVFAIRCLKKSLEHGSDYYIYIQPPGWEKEGSGYKIKPY